MPGGALRRALASAGAVLATLLASGAAVTLAPSAALAGTASYEAQFVAAMNSARSAAGLPAYAVAADLTSVARRHSAQMASRQTLYHNPDLTTEVHGWRAVGENVGEGPSVSSIHQAFMNSPEHRANILDRDFTQVGVGVSVDGNGMLWVTEDFRQPESAATPAPAAAPRAARRSGAQPATVPAGRSAAVPATAPAAGTPAAVPAAAPAAAPSPPATLLARLHALRRHARPVHDPVAQSLAYVATLSRLAG